MKSIYAKNLNDKFFVKNSSGKPEIVLIFPITRDGQESKTKWQAAIDFVHDSNIENFIVIDKTSQGSATKFFMEKFNLEEKKLYVLPRSIKESHYESLGGIEVDNNCWVMQLHDDDDWEGSVALPDNVKPSASYYSRFFMSQKPGRFFEQFDFTTPGRINFILVPSQIWNKFSLFIEDQNYHVAGSLDATLNQMVQLSTELLPIRNFSYYYDNHNWANRKSSQVSLNKLASSDGWGEWASIDIALFGRLLDNLTSLMYIQEFASQTEIKEKYLQLMKEFKSRIRHRISYKLKIFGLQIYSVLVKLLNMGADTKSLSDRNKSTIALATFIRKSWKVKRLDDVVELIEMLENMGNLHELKPRFRTWKKNISELEYLVGG